MDVKKFIEEFQDYLVPKLDTYEQAIYLYTFRHSRLLDHEEVTIGFKSVRKKLAFGVGKKGSAISESVCYEKLRSLESKGCLKILGTQYDGTRICLYLPNEIPEVIPKNVPPLPLKLEDINFFTVPENRKLILEREKFCCFYCLTKLDDKNHVIEHVNSNGSNSYFNLVAACRPCNNRKGNLSGQEFLRKLYRDNYLNSEEFEERLSQLELLQAGNLKPDISKIST